MIGWPPPQENGDASHLGGATPCCVVRGHLDTACVW